MKKVSVLLLGVGILVALAAPAPVQAGRRTGKKAGTSKSTGVTLILVLDRSGSMSGRKIARTRAAAGYAIGRLRKSDWVGVIAFDTSPRIVSVLGQKGSGKAHLARVKRITAGGGTSFLPALQATLKVLKRAPAKHRLHVIFLSDGQSPRLGVMSAVHSLVRARATLSTIALGQGADTAYLAKMARVGKGRAYTTTTTGLQKVCRQDLRRLGR